MQGQAQRASSVRPDDDPTVEQCERMVSILSLQLAELNDLVSDLTERRGVWLERLSLIRGGEAQSAIPRAPHGAVKALVLEELAGRAEGYEIGALVERVGQQLPTITQRSVRQVLVRLADQGRVRKSGLRWSIAT